MRKQGYTGQAKKADRGFYVILSICLVVIAVSSYVLFFSAGGSQADPSDATVYVPSDVPAVQTPVSVPDVDVPAEPAEPAVQPEPEPEPEPEPQPADEPRQTAAEAPAPIWVRPVDGAVLKDFSGDTLVKDETMGDWRVHTGTDYAADAGARVYAVSDGTVARAEMDAQYGGVVVLELTDGRQAVYRSLAEGLKVSAGDSVRAGDVIGTVGQSSAEAGQDSHLHLELYEDGAAIDPERVLGGAQQTASDAALDVSLPQDGIYVEE